MIAVKLNVPIGVNRRRYIRDWENFYRIRDENTWGIAQFNPSSVAGSLPIGLTVYKRDKWREYRGRYIMLDAMEIHLHQ